MSVGGIEVVRPGALATIQDSGRPGYAHLGVPHAGAADQASLRLANRLVGNAEGAAGMEITLGGAALRFTHGTWIALTGAPAPLRLGRHEVGRNAVLWAPGGSLLDVDVPARGVRTYLAVRGGIDVPPVLGSRSTDVLSGLGPAPLAAGDLLDTGDPVRCAPMEVDEAPGVDLPQRPVLRVLPGPREQWFAGEALATLTSTQYTVAPASNRVGVRLEGPALTRSSSRELPSEGMVTGALQVPPDGQPILFLADHPTTGGYPVIGVVASDDVPLAAQLRPGQPVRFRQDRP